MMKKNFSNFILILVFCIGLSLLLYPAFSDYWNTLHQSQVISSYLEAVGQVESSQYEQIWEDAHTYNQNLAKQGNTWTLSPEERNVYESLLSITPNGAIGYINIPMINCNLPIYHGTDEAVLQVAIGHFEGSSLPTGGESTHCVLTGHRGLPSAELFTKLDRLVVGDIFYLQILDETITYEVDQILIVKPYEMDSLEIQEGKDLCTLVTCTPYGVNSHRLLLRGHRIENIESTSVPRIVADAVQVEIPLVATFAAIPMLLVLLVFLLATTGKNRSKDDLENWQL